MPNHLASESSPYLLQHANNPVDWYPWGAEALRRAEDEERPIFLSIGYSACHWCHVMEHESFESTEIAAQLNNHFVCIKVDREERPDLDQIYMTAVQIMTGRGGWPMSVFLTPRLQPFFGGTYWPPTSRMGMPGFDQVLRAVVDAWTNRRDQAVAQASELSQHIRAAANRQVGESPCDASVLIGAAGQLEREFDYSHGGFGGAPKFPHPMSLDVLLRTWKRTRKPGPLELVRLTLDKMAAGGIYDHLAGGFARYSVDERWLVPHFEKMLYDNASLAAVYSDAFLATGDEAYAHIAGETLDYILTYMTDAQGAFHSTEDADSEGEEGKFYVWSRDEILRELGPERGAKFCYVFDVTERGNFEGSNILNQPKTLHQCAAIKGWDEQLLAREMTECRQQLRHVRDRRVRPAKDDKILVSWNGLMIECHVVRGMALAEPRFVQAAARAATFIWDQMRRRRRPTMAQLSPGAGAYSRVSRRLRQSG